MLVLDERWSKKSVGWRGHSGWAAQQAFKLLSSFLIKSPFVLTLDAKNHFLRPIVVDDFVSPDGRARSYDVKLAGVAERWLKSSYKVLGIRRPLSDVEEIPPSITPLVFPRIEFEQAVRFIEGRVGAIESFFVSRQSRATEFMLLFAVFENYLGGRDRFFAKGLFRPNSIFASFTPEKIDSVISAVELGTTAVFSLHRKKVVQLTDEQRSKICQIWCEACLFSDLGEAEAALAEMRAI